MVHPDWNLFKSPIQYSGVKQMAEEYQKSKEQGTTYLSHNIVFKKKCFIYYPKNDLFNYLFFPKFLVTKALMDAGCGHWIEKPVEQDQFSL